jgi:hypothetical protein
MKMFSPRPKLLSQLPGTSWTSKKRWAGSQFASMELSHSLSQLSLHSLSSSTLTRTSALDCARGSLFALSNRLEEYNLASFEHWRTDAEFFTCLKPTCGFVALIDPFAPGYPHVECPSPICKARSCASCRTAWHMGQTCTEVYAAAATAQISEAERTTLALMQEVDARRCPNCQFVIEKDGGCPSMQCGGCRKLFNWEEAASVVPGTRKPEPQTAVRDEFYMPVATVCGADGLESKGGQDLKAEDTLAASAGLVCELRENMYPPMPLPERMMRTCKQAFISIRTSQQPT